MKELNWENGQSCRAVIKYFCKKGMSQKEIYEAFIKTVWDESHYSTVKKWAAEFRRERGSVEDYEWSGHPKEATTEENIELVRSLIICDKRRSLHDIARQIGISFRAVQSIFTDILGMSKVSAMGPQNFYQRSEEEQAWYF